MGNNKNEREREGGRKDVKLACLDTIFTMLKRDSNQTAIERDKRREREREKQRATSSLRCFDVTKVFISLG